jgi:ribose transport system substrate-binding protein
MKEPRTTLVSLSAFSLLALGLAACTSPADAESATAEDVATPTSSAELTVAFFQAGSSNAYLQANIDAAEELAGELGMELDVFDAQWDAQTQANQMQTALTSGKYNAMMILPVDGNLVCDSITEDAIPAGMLVSVLNLPICGRETAVGEETREPGTVTFVGGQTRPVYDEWVDEVIADHPDGGTAALVAGPDLSANTITFFAAAEKLEENGFTVVARQTTDYTTPRGNSAATAILSANPDLTVLMSNYSGVTLGVVQAVADAGRTGDVDIYDVGGDEWGLEQVRAGTLKSTVMLLPRRETEEALQALADAADGKDVAPFIDLAEDPSLPGTVLARKDNVDEFTAEY